jgi:predicted HicB family RNase H-like nuclease
MSESAFPVQLGYSNDPTPEEFAKRQVALDLEVKVGPEASTEAKEREMLRLAEIAFPKTGLWVVFYRTLLGVDGLVNRLFPNPEEKAKFQASAAHAEIQEMVAALRSSDTSKGDSIEPERMITIRIPMSLHAVLVEEAEQLGLSINQICVSKLLCPLNSRHIPEFQGRRRGRKPGPQGFKKVKH